MKPAGVCLAGMLAYSRVKSIVPHRRTLRRVACIAFAALDPRPCYQCLSEQEQGHFRNREKLFRAVVSWKKRPAARSNRPS